MPLSFKEKMLAAREETQRAVLQLQEARVHGEGAIALADDISTLGELAQAAAEDVLGGIHYQGKTVSIPADSPDHMDKRDRFRAQIYNLLLAAFMASESYKESEKSKEDILSVAYKKISDLSDDLASRKTPRTYDEHFNAISEAVDATSSPQASTSRSQISTARRTPHAQQTADSVALVRATSKMK